MTSESKTWENLKAEYLSKVEKVLSSVKHPRIKDILEDVHSHLDRRFAELKPDEQTRENLQAIVAEMGPASDYAELLDPDAAVPNRGVQRKYLLWIGIAAAVIIAAAILLPMIILERGRIVDRIDYPFVNDPDVIGTWQSVDFVTNIGDFKPGVKLFQGDLYLKEMVILEGGKTFKPWWTWTKGLIFHSGDKTASKYHIKEINGSTYVFFEWKSGDYTIQHMKPKYYVLKKAGKLAD